MLKAAKARGTGKTLRYTRGDMRSLPLRWTRRFDGVVNLFTSFGFFDNPADDARVLKQVARVLKRGGSFVWQGAIGTPSPTASCAVTHGAPKTAQRCVRTGALTR